MRWYLMSRPTGQSGNPEVLGKFESVSLAVREIKLRESIQRVLVPLEAFYSADFDEDEEGLSHYKYIAGPMTYFIRRVDPKPRKGMS